jgi:outer membrane protein
MRRKGRSALLTSVVLVWLATGVTLLAQAPQDPQGFLRDYSQGPTWFPSLLRPYQQQPITPVAVENSSRINSLIHDGKLELSLADALALALENNLDIAVQRYLIPISQTDVLRTKGGQAARGVTGALVPSGLSAGALGAGVSAAGGGGGVGSAGGITGGGGAVQISPVGNFDPAVNFNFSWDRASTPLNTGAVTGVTNVTSYATAYSGTYAQLFPTGTSYFVSLNGQRQSSTSQNQVFNPAVVTRLSLAFNQPLLSGFGLRANERFIIVAKNDTRITQETFRLQVVSTIVTVEDTYWDLAQFQENIKVAEQSLAASQRLYEDNKKQAEVGTLAALDVVSAEAEVAGRERDLVVARTNAQLQATKLKNLLTKKPDPAVDKAEVLITTQLPEPRDVDIPKLENALSNAATNRPELRQAQGNIQNQDVSVAFTRNNLLPGLNTFAMYAGSGLQGNCTSLLASATGVCNNATGLITGASNSLGQTFGGDFPEYAGGLTLNLPIRNRSAQADSLRAQMENDQLAVGLQRTSNQVALEVRQAMIGLEQGKAQVEAAHQATRLARETLDAEQKKLAAGVSTSYNVILRERDLTTAQYAEVQAVDAYSKALVEMDRSTGTTLDRNGINLVDAAAGSVTKMPTPPFNVRGFSTQEQNGNQQ